MAKQSKQTRKKKTQAAKNGFRRGEVITLERLDSLLDVPVSRFDRVVDRLVKEFRAKSVRVEIPDARELAAWQPMDPRVAWTGIYEAQVQRLPRMDRAEEFRMAKRYEFLKARARAALEECGYHNPDELTRRSFEDLPAPTRKPRAAAQRYLQIALEELTALRNLYIERSLYMVLAGAHRYRGLGVDFADLIQEGNASLFQAIEGFDWRRDVRFKTYAQYWIHQAILKVLYNTSRTVRVPIWVQKALHKIRRIRQESQRENGEEPPAEVVAEKLGIPAEKVEELLATKRYATSLDAEIPGEDGASLGQLLPDDRAVPVPDAIQDGDLGERLREVMADLPEREQMILRRRFGLDGHEPETLGSIAEDLGITAERVRQLQKAALARLQKPRKMARLHAFA